MDSDHRKVRAQLRWISGLAIVVVLFASVALFHLLGQTAFVESTYAYDDRLRTLTLSHDRAETAIRTYLITQDPHYFKKYQSLLGRLAPDLEQLRANTLTANGKDWLQSTLPLINQHTQEMQQVAVIKDRQGIAAAHDYLVSNANLAAKEELVAAFRTRHERVLQEMRSRTKEQSRDIAWLATSSSLVSIFMLVLCVLLRRSMRRSLEADRLKSEFVANLSHEMRTPMFGILGNSELLESESDPAEVRAIAAAIRNSAQNLMLSLNDMIDFVKIEAGSLEIERQPFSLPELIEEVTAQVKPDADDKSITLETFVHSGVPETIYGDKNKVRRVLANLVHNAVRFTDSGRVRISLLMRDQALHPTLHFAVTDTGVGVPAERIASVTLPFVQGDGSNTRRHGGLGLGLTIADGLVKRMGGEFGFVSKDGRGSAFWFDLPVD